jgi:hypothetical protein
VPFLAVFPVLLRAPGQVITIGGSTSGGENRRTVYRSPYDTTATLSLVSTRISLEDIVDTLHKHRCVPTGNPKP